MNGNGRKPSSKQSERDEHPWWHSGSHCLAALLWCFTLAVAWRGIFSGREMTLSFVGALVVGLSLAILQSSMASVKGKRQ